MIYIAALQEVNVNGNDIMAAQCTIVCVCVGGAGCVGYVCMFSIEVNRQATNLGAEVTFPVFFHGMIGFFSIYFPVGDLH